MKQKKYIIYMVMLKHDACQGDVARKVDLGERLSDRSALAGLARPDEHLDEAARFSHACDERVDERSAVFVHGRLLLSKFAQ